MSFIIFFVFVIVVASAQENDKEGKIACYYTNWSYKRDASPFHINRINPFLCTHLIYSFLTFDFENDAITADNPQQDLVEGGFRHFNQLKATNPKLKTLAALGGWDEGGARFSQIAAHEKRRAAFANNTRDFLKKHRFNGINIDWQFPGNRGGKKEDYENFVYLVKDMKTAYDSDPDAKENDKLIVTISVPDTTDYIDDGYDLPKLSKYVEFITLICYNYHTAVEPFVYHHSPIYPLPNEKESDRNYKLNVEFTVKYVLKSGVPAEKFLLGIPTYGRTYILEDENEHAFGSPVVGEGKAGKSTREKQSGYKAFFEICAQIRDEKWKVETPYRNLVGPYAHKNDDWVGYDDPKSAYIKGKYAKERGLGGLMIWTLDDDDFNGECYDEGHPVINAAKRGFAEATAPTRPPSTSPPTSSPSTPSTSPPTSPLTSPPTSQQTSSPTTPPTSPPTTPSTPPLRNKTAEKANPEIPSVPLTPPPRFRAPARIIGNQQKISNRENEFQQPATNRPSIFIDRQKESGGNTYYQTVSVWVVNNVFHWGQSSRDNGAKISDVTNSFIPTFLSNLLDRLN